MVRWHSTVVKRIVDLLIGNATTTDLWEALSKASGKDVNKFMVIPLSISCRRTDMADGVLGPMD